MEGSDEKGSDVLTSLVCLHAVASVRAVSVKGSQSVCCRVSHSAPNPLCVDECRCGNVRACLRPRSCVKGLVSFCVFTVSVLLVVVTWQQSGVVVGS